MEGRGGGQQDAEVDGSLPFDFGEASARLPRRECTQRRQHPQQRTCRPQAPQSGTHYYLSAPISANQRVSCTMATRIPEKPASRSRSFFLSDKGQPRTHFVIGLGQAEPEVRLYETARR